MLGNDHRVVTVMSQYWAKFIKRTGGSVLARDYARLSSMRDGELQMARKYKDTTARVGAFLLWVDEHHPEVLQEFERWRDSMDRRDE